MLIEDQESLLTMLRGMRVTIPLRTEGRDTRKHVEPRVFCMLLAALAKENLLTYPLSFEQRERPDFLLVQGDRQIGVEISEVIPTDYARCIAAAEKMDRGSNPIFLEPGHFRTGSPKTTRKRIQRLLDQPHLTARPYYGNEPEKEWAGFMEKSIETKRGKLAQEDFTKFDENWLLLYDNVLPSAVRWNEAVSLLRTSLPNLWTAKPKFDVIFFETDAFIIKLAANETDRFALEDIWS
jgi:hypothetical protein